MADIEIHYKKILESNGFIISNFNDEVKGKIKKSDKENMIEIVNEVKKDFLEEFYETDDKYNPKYKNILDRLEYLNIAPYEIELMKEYEDIIFNRNGIEYHNNIIIIKR
jgi:hypothetical protein